EPIAGGPRSVPAAAPQSQRVWRNWIERNPAREGHQERRGGRLHQRRVRLRNRLVGLRSRLPRLCLARGHGRLLRRDGRADGQLRLSHVVAGHRQRRVRQHDRGEPGGVAQSVGAVANRAIAESERLAALGFDPVGGTPDELAAKTPRAITGKIARLLTTAWPASPKKDADARNKRGHRERAEFHLSKISRPRECDPWPRSSSRPTSSGTWHCPK